jgi:hypothetical protein
MKFGINALDEKFGHLFLCSADEDGHLLLC